MSLYFGLIMFLVIVPTLLICNVQIYPKKWKDRKLIFGVRNREEFRTGETLETVEKIYEKYRSQANKVTIGGCIIAAILLLLKGIALQTTVWTTFVLLALLAINTPYYFGNREMKDLKRRLGLNGQAGVSFVDLSNAGSIRALKTAAVILPNLVGLAIVIVAVLADLGTIRARVEWAQGSFICTGVSVIFWAMGLLMAFLAALMDRTRNEVISKDSAINANYNRAKKKNFADVFVIFIWGNTVFMAVALVSFLFWYQEMMMMFGLAVYFVLVMAGVVFFVLRERKIEEHYQKDIEVITDDDDNWIFGMFYYNPKDKRMNVEKRIGVGGTINLAHPAGKLTGVLLAFSILITILSCVWICMMEETPVSLRVDDGKVICHQLRDEYVIGLSDIVSVEYGDSLSGMHFYRVSGVGMDTLLKGNFTVNEEHGCKVFLAPDAGNYIRIETSGQVYYISGATAQETKEVYDLIAERR